MALERVNTQATSLSAAMTRLPDRAASTTRVEPSAMPHEAADASDVPSPLPRPSRRALLTRVSDGGLQACAIGWRHWRVRRCWPAAWRSQPRGRTSRRLVRSSTPKSIPPRSATGCSACPRRPTTSARRTTRPMRNGSWRSSRRSAGRRTSRPSRSITGRPSPRPWSSWARTRSRPPCASLRSPATPPPGRPTRAFRPTCCSRATARSPPRSSM